MKHWIPALSLAFATSAALAGSSSPRDGLLDPNFAVGGDRVVEFDLGPNGTDLYAATHGRGLWRIALP